MSASTLPGAGGGSVNSESHSNRREGRGRTGDGWTANVPVTSINQKFTVHVTDERTVTAAIPTGAPHTLSSPSCRILSAQFWEAFFTFEVKADLTYSTLPYKSLIADRCWIGIGIFTWAFDLVWLRNTQIMLHNGRIVYSSACNTRLI